jgi:hypothetical protein
MESSSETSSYARRFLVIWGALAALNFVIAAVLTAILVHIPTLESPYHPVGMYGEYRKDAVGWIYYYSTKSGSTYLIYYPAHTKLVALPYGKFTMCVGDRPAKTRIPPQAIAISRYEDHAFYLITLSSRLHGAPVDGEATCTIAFAATRSSFTSLAMDIWFMPSLPSVVPAATLNYSVEIDGAENMQVFGERSTSSSSAALAPDDEIVIEYNDIRREGFRDIMLIVIGALVGLGAAMSLEAIRPYVEMTAARRSKRRG